MRLMRLVGRNEYDGCSAGQWLVPGAGLMLYRDPHCGCWLILPSFWVDTHIDYEAHPQGDEWYGSRARWLAQHGLDQAEFARRGDAARALEYALTRHPLPQLGINPCA